MSDLQTAIDFLGSGVVSARKPAASLKRTAGTGSVVRLGVIESKLPTLRPAAIDRLAEKLEVSEVVVLDVSNIPARTFHRRQSSDQSLTPTEADRVLRIARVAGEAERVFADAGRARRWLTTPSAVLGDIPLHLLGSDSGAREVEAELGRIDWGDFA